MATPPVQPPEWTWSDLATIDAAIATGAAEVRFQDRTIRYKSADDLLKLRSIIWLYLHPGSVRQLLVFTRKGF
jgi:hypothetical protein